MIKKNICLSILLLSTLTMSIPVKAAEPSPEVAQVVQQAEPQSEQQVDTQSEQQVDAQKEQLTPQISLIQYSSVSSCNAVLNITSSGTANAGAYIAGYPSTTTQITGYLYLERKSGTNWLNAWSWSANTASAYLNMSDSCTVTTRGTYRLRLSGYVYSGTSYEQITAYSNEFTY